MKTIKIQLGFFFQSDYLGLPEDFASLVQRQFGQTDNKMFVPLPKVAPSDIPRVELKFSNFEIKIAKSRLDLFCSDLIVFNENYEKYNSLNFNELGINIIRIGLVFNYFDGDKTKKDLFDIFSDKVKAKDLAEIEVRLNNITDIKGFKCNNLNIFQLGKEIDVKGQSLGNVKEGILIQNDFNNIPQQGKILTDTTRLDLVKEFISKSEDFFVKL